MKLYDRNNFFMLNESRSTPISVDEVKEILSKFDPAKLEYIKENTIYRGMISKDLYLIVDPKEHNRASKNTTNEYNLIMSHSDNWKEYPKRTQSIICSNSEFISNGFGDKIFIVIPLEDKPKFGICSSSDLWDSFGNLMLNDFNDYLRDTLDLNSSDDLTYEKLSDKLKKFTFKDAEKSIAKSNGVENFLKILNYKEGDNLLDVVLKFLDPNENNFHLKTYYVDNFDDLSREVWTDSKSLLIHESEILKFIQ